MLTSQVPNYEEIPRLKNVDTDGNSGTAPTPTVVRKECMSFVMLARTQNEYSTILKRSHRTTNCDGTVSGILRGITFQRSSQPPVFL